MKGLDDVNTVVMGPFVKRKKNKQTNKQYSFIHARGGGGNSITSIYTRKKKRRKKAIGDK